MAKKTTPKKLRVTADVLPSVARAIETTGKREGRKPATQTAHILTMWHEDQTSKTALK